MTRDTYDFDKQGSSIYETRTIELFGEVTTEMARMAVSQLRMLANNKPGEQITIDVMSPGGEVSAGLAIIDAARTCGCPIRTIGFGVCASMAAHILACAGDKGKRFVMPNAEVMIHQVLSGMQGQESDLQIAAEHTSRTRARLDELLAAACNRSVEEVHAETERNKWLLAQEAIDFGLVDAILSVPGEEG